MKYNELNLGQIEAVVNKLGGMDGVQRFLSGNAEVVVKNYVINCDADPYLPDGWKVEEHQKGGEFIWDASKVSLFLSENQKVDTIEGNKLRKKLKGKPVLNACVLDYLLANPHLIPEEWKGKYVYFWGTIYRSSDGDLWVRYLYWDDRSWDWDCSWFGNNWDDGNPAALCAS